VADFIPIRRMLLLPGSVIQLLIGCCMYLCIVIAAPAKDAVVPERTGVNCVLSGPAAMNNSAGATAGASASTSSSSSSGSKSPAAKIPMNVGKTKVSNISTATDTESKTGSDDKDTAQNNPSTQTPEVASVGPVSKRSEIPGAIAAGGDSGDELFGMKFDNSHFVDRTQKNDQGDVWQELDSLRGRDKMSAGEIQDILAKSVPGKDYPTYSSVPTTSFRCENVHQAGFYADPETRCQVIRRCDINGIKWNYICPNATLFNQITLTCEWYFNIDCSKAVQYYDYSNSRLYHSDWLLLDTPPETQK